MDCDLVFFQPCRVHSLSPAYFVNSCRKLMDKLLALHSLVIVLEQP